jgi:hypothetical protein
MEKTKLHRLNRKIPDAGKGRVLDYGIADMASVILPDYAVIDGTIGMEGLGPSVGTPRELGVVLASADPLAADFTALRLMGMPVDAASHLNLIRERLRPDLDPARPDVEPPDYADLAASFEPASLRKLQGEYPNLRIVDQGACSACSAALMIFARTHGKRFPGRVLNLGAGKDLRGSDFKPENGEEIYCIGNCAAKAAADLDLDYCKGCPPVGSSILAHIQGEKI